ncbi:DUF3037 domain-containing protein [Ideonella sp. BN130291]|uniref:DUF3037 domain-containing protein n=1 Tax=Ideonella sp. BN130291 TaxID=3112940 RepID=UPI002E270506|nr:DUF3037 domain-containing protein [Ideonella sp. BN130291]
MPTLHTYDYAIVRVVPRVDRGEFINAGVIIACARAGYLKAFIELDEARLQALDPSVDLTLVRATLATLPVVCEGGPGAGPLGRLSLRERFDWLVAPRSSSIQTSPVHAGRCDDLGLAGERLLARMVRAPAPPVR